MPDRSRSEPIRSEPIRVFLVDDHEIVRRGIAGLLTLERDIEVVGEAATAAQARGRIAATRPDVALLDVRLPTGAASTCAATCVRAIQTSAASC